MEWGRDPKNGYDYLEVYMKYGYLFVSITGRNHAKMAYYLFDFVHVLQIWSFLDEPWLVKSLNRLHIVAQIINYIHTSL